MRMKLSTHNRRPALAEALKKGKIKLAFQPIYESGGERFNKAEVLCRLEYGGKIVMPGDFIPYAEQNGYIDAVTIGVLKELGECRARSALENIVFSVNISPVQLKKKGFGKCFSAWVEESGLEPKSIIAEITETEEYEVGGTVAENLAALEQSGFFLAVDDFGKGSSDIEKVALLPVRYIKIDKMYIDRIEESGVERMLRIVIGYAGRTGKKCVAEGVETVRQKQILERLCCHYFQGYLFSRPLYEEEFLLAVEKRGSVPARGQISTIAYPASDASADGARIYR